MAKYVHDELEAYLQAKKTKGQLVSKRPSTKLSSLDLVIYAYLKEEMVNTPDSAEVKYLKESCPLLNARIEFIDLMFGLIEEKAKPKEEVKVEEKKVEEKPVIGIKPKGDQGVEPMEDLEDDDNLTVEEKRTKFFNSNKI